jgi:hypothetical protein
VLPAHVGGVKPCAGEAGFERTYRFRMPTSDRDKLVLNRSSQKESNYASSYDAAAFG